MIARSALPIAWLLAASVGVVHAAPAGPGALPDFGAASLWAERRTAPEPLSSWAAIETEIERLAAHGELPLEALALRPLDRGELAAWLLASSGAAFDLDGVPAATSPANPGDRGAPESLARRRLAALLRSEIDRLTGGDAAARAADARRPGACVREREGARALLAGPYLRLGPTLADGERGDWTDSTRAGLRLVALLGSRVAMSGGLFAAEVPRGRSFADPLVAGTDLILHEEQMTLSARAAGLRLRLGRDRHRWGPGRTGTLLLSDAAEPFNFGEYQVRLGSRLRFLALTGATNLPEHRYVAAHRLVWTPRADLSIGLAEGARYEAEGLHLLYALGIAPYTLVERFDLQDSAGSEEREHQRNNVLWSCDVVWRPRPGCLLYGEVLADDIGTEDACTPTRGAFQAGATLAPRWRGRDWTLGLEFTRVSNYTYAVYYQDLCACDWEHQHEPLGYAEGPDVAVIAARCGSALDAAWEGGAWVRHLVRGEGRLGDAWSPSPEGCDPRSGRESFGAWSLAGDPRRVWALGASLDWRPRPALRCGLWGEARWTGDEAVAGEEGWGSRLGVSLSAGME